MTEQNIPEVTDDDRKLAREWAEFIESDVTGLSSRRKRAAARVILDAVPAPPLPTLADMTPEERDDCQWMQADTVGADDTCVLFVIGTGSAKGVAKSGRVTTGPHECFTPRPDLPRMEWPGDKKPDPGPALPNGWRVADHKDNGRVIVTNTTPNRDGYVYFVLPAADPLGYDWFFCTPAELTYLPQ